MAEGANRMNGVHLDNETGTGEIVEFATYIRERPVACQWSSGVVTGDPELMARLSHTVMADGWAETPSSVARALSAAVGSPVTIRVVSDLEVDLAGGELSTLDVLGDYWLG